MRTASFKKVFAEAYDLYATAIFKHCFYSVRNRQLALDLMQETFTKTWQHLAAGKKVEHMKSFLYTVSNRLIIDRSRKRREASLDTMTETGFDRGALDLRIQRDVIASVHVMKMLDSLSPKYRKVVAMRYIDDLKPREIATILGESVNVISVRIHHGLKELRIKHPEKF